MRAEPETNGVSNVRNLKKSIGALVLAATAITGFSATPALARHGNDDGYYSRGDRYDRDDRREYRRGDRYYRNNAYRGNARCDKGKGGTIIGAAVGALAGRAIDKSDSNCRSYR